MTYTKGGSDSEKFTIDSSTGVVSMVGKDYENPTDADTKNTYEIGITATDSDDNTATASWVVTVEDINEEAVFEITSIPNATVNENASSIQEQHLHLLDGTIGAVRIHSKWSRSG